MAIAGAWSPTAPGIGYILSNGAYTTFAAPGDSTITSVRGINANGDVAGTVRGPPQPFLRTSNGAFNVISLPLGNEGSIAGLNPSDEIAGDTLEKITLGKNSYYPVDTCFAWTKRCLTTSNPISSRPSPGSTKTDQYTARIKELYRKTWAHLEAHATNLEALKPQLPKDLLNADTPSSGPRGCPEFR
jgi:hypothetical protein